MSRNRSMSTPGTAWGWIAARLGLAPRHPAKRRRARAESKAGTWKPRFRGLILRSAVLGVGLAAGAALADARDGSPPGDWQLTLQARHALWGDAPFDRLNLGVSVRDGVAVLSGPVPSSGLASQAMAKLRTVPGIRDVKNETYVPPADEPLAQSMPHPVMARRPSVSVAPAGMPPDPPPASPAAVPVAPPRETTVSLAPPTVPVKRMSIADQAEALRLADRRFQNVRIDVRDNVIVLRGNVARSADAWEFAATMRRIAGVTNVVQRIETGR